MTCDPLNPYQGLGGGIHGGHWQAHAQAQSSAAYAAYSTYVGTIGSGGPGAAVQEPDPIEDAGIRAGEIEAIRVWLLKNGYLYSMFANYVWSPGQVETGNLDEGAGIHAFKTVGQAMVNYGYSGCDECPLVIGRVLLWGTVIEHEKGYRAEFAAIKSLDEMIPVRGPKKRWFKPVEFDFRLEVTRQKYLLIKET